MTTFNSKKAALISQLHDTKMALVRECNRLTNEYLNAPLGEGEEYINLANKLEKDVFIKQDQLDRAYALGRSSKPELPKDVAIYSLNSDDLFDFTLEYLYVRPFIGDRMPLPPSNTTIDLSDLPE